jgi:phospholipid transport system substrate-binding protein
MTAAVERPDRRLVLKLGAMGALLALAPMVAGWPTLAAPTTDAARTLVESVGAEVIGVLQADITNDEKLKRLVALLEDAIDVDLVARLILGRHWRGASEAQQKDYLELFRAYALDRLASKLHLYKGQQFEVTDSRVADKRDALVTTEILSNDRPPLHVAWRIRERDGGELVAIDVIVESVSLIITQRSEFASVIERRGLDGLLDELRSRLSNAA